MIDEAKEQSSSFIKDIIRAAFVTGKLTIVRILAGFGRSKVNAIFLGTAGLGLYSQANYLSLFFISACSLGLVNGMMQRISSSREKGLLIYQKSVQATVLTTQIVLVLIVLLLSFFLAPQLNNKLFDAQDSKLTFFIFLLIVSIPFSVISSNYMEGFFFSYGRYDLYTKASIVATILSFAFFIPLVYFFDIYGAVSSLLLSAVILFACYIYYIRKIERLSNVFILGFKKNVFLEILPEGLINLFYGALVPFSALFIRNLIIKHDGPSENGLYQICTSITALYVPFLTNPLWAKMFPTVSAKGNSRESNFFLGSTIFITTIISTFIILVLLVKPDWIIQILSSKKFVGSIKFFPIYFLGDFFFNILFVYSVYLLALRHIKEYSLIWMVFFSAQYVISQILIQSYGSKGIPAGYAISSLILIVYVFSVFYRLLRKDFYRYLMIFLCSALVIITEGYLLYKNFSFIWRVGCLVLWGGLICVSERNRFSRISSKFTFK